MSLRVGSLCYDRIQGLGLLAQSFFSAGVITDVVVVHRPGLGSAGMFPGAPRVQGSWESVRREVEALCDRVDVMLFLETPFFWEAIPYCRKRGVKTVLSVMYECLPPVSRLPYQPDLFHCPSLLDLRYFPDRSVYIPVPVSVPWRKREVAEVFVHNAGHLGLRGRNGTAELVDALPLVTSGAKILIRSQKALAGPLRAKIAAAYKAGVDVEYSHGTLPQEGFWDRGDVFVFPEKFNGLSLPIQEAFASGMTVMATDRFPNNDYLPLFPLIPVKGYRRASAWRNCVEFDEAVIDPKDIAARIDELFSKDISVYSAQGKAWAETMSWAVLKPRYLEVLETLCGK